LSAPAPRSGEVRLLEDETLSPEELARVRQLIAKKETGE
jgi:hypothetical protein